MKRSNLKTIISCTIALAATVIPGLLHAQSELTVTLEPTEEAKSSIVLKHETTGSTKKNSETKYQQVSKTEVGKAAIARVGKITADKTKIMRSPQTRSLKLYVCPKDTYIAIVNQSGNWYGVLMSDSSIGWISKSNVEVLDYQLTCDLPKSSNQIGNRIIDTALRYLGISYKWGGYSLNGLDCSGFVKAVFASHGISLPRTAKEQALVGAPVYGNDVSAGDRLYFSCKGKYIDHTGIYMGNGYFIHSSIGKGGVNIDKITKPLYANSLVAIRR